MKRSLTRLFGAFAAAALTGAVVVTTGATATSADSPPLESQMLSLVQQQRAAAGLPPLIVSAGLTTAAAGWSGVELAYGTIAHDPFIGAYLAPWWQAWGEDVGMGSSPTSIMAAFMASPEHRANILGAYNRVGVGVSVAGNGAEYVTLDFERFPPGY